MSRDICVIGNLNPDLMHSLAGFPAWSSEVITKRMGCRPGGIGNALLCLARVVVGPSVIANVGNAALAQELLSTLEEAGVDIRHVERCAVVHTGVSLGLGREEGERAFVTDYAHVGCLDIDLMLRHRAA